jgi:hypothetical protein
VGGELGISSMMSVSLDTAESGRPGRGLAGRNQVGLVGSASSSMKGSPRPGYSQGPINSSPGSRGNDRGRDRDRDDDDDDDPKVVLSWGGGSPVGAGIGGGMGLGAVSGIGIGGGITAYASQDRLQSLGLGLEGGTGGNGGGGGSGMGGETEYDRNSKISPHVFLLGKRNYAALTWYRSSAFVSYHVSLTDSTFRLSMLSARSFRLMKSPKILTCHCPFPLHSHAPLNQLTNPSFAVVTMYFLSCMMDSGLFTLLPVWMASKRSRGESKQDPS